MIDLPGYRWERIGQSSVMAPLVQMIGILTAGAVVMSVTSLERWPVLVMAITDGVVAVFTCGFYLYFVIRDPQALRSWRKSPESPKP